MKKKINYIKIHLIILSLAATYGCKKFIEVPTPNNTINEANVYASDATAIAVMTGLYTNLSLDDGGMRLMHKGLPLLSVYPGLSSDELVLYSGATDAELMNYYQNKIDPAILTNTDFWSTTYKYLFVINSAIDGLNKSSTLTPAVKTQLLGEAYFLRAFCYFYLVNLYGDVPYITSTDYSLTSKQPRDSKENVYKQIVLDLLLAKKDLNENFVDITVINSTEERSRPSKSAAIALLARVYLYTNDWTDAEDQSTDLIADQSRFDLVGLDEVFLKNGKESIWAIQPVSNDINSNTGDGRLFILPDQGPWELNQVYLNDAQVDSFDPGDQRLVHWINHMDANGVTYYYPFKYKIGEAAVDNAEYTVVLRLAEQYLIRAEARIQQNKIAEGVADLNKLRARATDTNASDHDKLQQLSSNLTKEQALTAVLHERQVELFTEWGHRWFDIKRTGEIDRIMPSITLKKGGIWSNTAAFYPIPLKEIQANKNLIQNKGY